MAKKAKRKYSRGAGKDVKSEMHRYKRGTAKSGRGVGARRVNPFARITHCNSIGLSERTGARATLICVRGARIGDDQFHIRRPSHPGPFAFLELVP